MSAFTEQVALDLPVFIPLAGSRPAEFDQLRTIDGVPGIACVLDADERATDAETGIYVSRSVLHVRTADLPAIPVVKGRMVIDGKPANVIHVDDAMGMLSVSLEWFES